jgi:hypothetical protein
MLRAESPKLPFDDLQPGVRQSVAEGTTPGKSSASTGLRTPEIEPIQLGLFGPQLKLVNTGISYEDGCIRHKRLLAPPEISNNWDTSWERTGDLFWDYLNDPLQFDRYVRRCKMGYLDRHFPSWVARMPKLHKLSFELAKINKHWLGDIVQMTEQELLAVPGASPQALEILKADLAGVGLQLGMHTWGWHPTKAPYIQR